MRIAPPRTLEMGVYISPPLCTDHLALCAHKHMSVTLLIIDCLYVYTYLYVHYINHHSRWCHHLLLLPIEPTPETGPNDGKVIWAPGKFFFTYSLLVIFQLTYIFHVLYVLMHNNKTTSGRWWRPLLGPRKHPQPLLWATARGVGMGATTKQQEKGNATTKPNENGTQMERWETRGDNMEEARQTKKGPRDIVWCLLGHW